MTIMPAPPPIRHRCGVSDRGPATYFESFTPEGGSCRPTVVMIHGGAHSGSCWTVTPDGRPGWAYDFVARGYPAVVTDWPGVGRSGAIPPDDLTGEIVCEGLGQVVAQIDGPVVMLTHSMGGAWGWVIAERHRTRLHALVAVAPGPPGNIQPEPVLLSRSEAAIELQAPHRRVMLPRFGLVANEASFIDEKLIGTSTQFPKEYRDRYAASLLPTASPLLQQRLNISGSQMQVADPGRYRDLAVLLVTGPEDLEHPYETDAAIVEWLRTHGARAEFTWLADHGITGNGHMLMLERNSRAIADLVCDWLDRQA